MGQVIDLKGERFGRWLVLSRLPDDEGKRTVWKCLCECGTIRAVKSGGLRRGQSKSCGCYAREVASKMMKTHGMTDTPEWKSWMSIGDRCNSPNNKDYPNYGGRGIKICDRWNPAAGGSFGNFLEDMGRRGGREYSIEREDVNGDYCPSNCKWILKSEQARNKRKQKNNTSGHVGVIYVKADDCWRACWRDPEGRRKGKSFPVRKHGYEQAFEMACKARDAAIDSLKSHGVFYGDSHGR